MEREKDREIERERTESSLVVAEGEDHQPGDRMEKVSLQSYLF